MHTPGDDIQLGRIREAIDSIDDRLGKIEYTLNGNGVPGLKTRIDRMEQTHVRQGKFITWISGLVTAMFAIVASAAVKLLGD